MVEFQKSIFIHHKICDLVAICDNDKERLNEVRRIIEDCQTEFNHKLINLNEFDNDNSLFIDIKENRLKVDLLVLTTPSGLHPKHTIMGAELGINICTEKPMATNWEDGLKMYKFCKLMQLQH